MDGCGEAGEAQGILDGSNFVATSLQLRSDFVATSSDLQRGRPLRGGSAALPDHKVEEIPGTTTRDIINLTNIWVPP